MPGSVVRGVACANIVVCITGVTLRGAGLSKQSAPHRAGAALAAATSGGAAAARLQCGMRCLWEAASCSSVLCGVGSLWRAFLGCRCIGSVAWQYKNMQRSLFLWPSFVCLCAAVAANNGCARRSLKII